MRKLLPLIAIVLMLSCSEKTYTIGKIEIPQGEILVYLFEDTPNHREAFIDLANEGYWNDYTFNRVIEDFVAQGGCPDTPEGFAYSVHLLAPEFEPGHQHVYGAFGAGRDNNPDKLSAACQFYIVQSEDGLSRLDGEYQIYGHVIKGMDVVDAIVTVEKDGTNKPLVDIPLKVSVIEMNASDLKALGFDPNIPLAY